MTYHFTKGECDRLPWEAFPNQNLIGGLQRYMVDKVPPGSFLTHVLCNRLTESFGQADHINARLMPRILEWLCTHYPKMIWGSEEAVQSYLASRKEKTNDRGSQTGNPGYSENQNGQGQHDGGALQQLQQEGE